MSAGFVCAMEDVLDLYARPPGVGRPLVCFDERPVQLVAHARTPVPPAPGRPERVDDEYVRCGTCNLFTFFAPHIGWRHVEVTDRRTKADFARMMEALVDTYCPYATTVRVVPDNLNVHALASLYEAFPPAEARRTAKKIELHDTPKHGSWLNMAEAEIALLSPRPAAAGRRRGAPRPGGQGAAAQRRAGDGLLALHGQGRPPQAAPPVPVVITVADH